MNQDATGKEPLPARASLEIMFHRLWRVVASIGLIILAIFISGL